MNTKNSSERKYLIGFISFIALAIIIVGSFFILGNTIKAAYDLYNEVPEIKYNDILTKNEKTGSTIYYIYGDKCVHCENIKPKMNDFGDKLNQKDLKNTKIYRTNMDNSENSAAVKNKAATKTLLEDMKADKNFINKLKKITDMKYYGTPTIIYVKDGKVKDVGVGEGTTEHTVLNVVSEIKKDLKIK